MTGPTRRKIVQDATAIGLAVAAYGVSFGAIAIAAGLSVPQACALSLLAFTGASQFAFVGVVGAGGTPIAGVTTALLLGSRNALYGARLASLLRVSGGRRLVAAHGVIDETTAMATTQPDVAAGRFAFWVTAAAVFAGWNVATLLGALGAGALGDPEQFGLDAAVPAAFLALLWSGLRDAVPRRVALLAAAVAVAAATVLPAGVPVLLAAIPALGLGMRRR